MNKENLKMEKLESISRLKSIPIVETGWSYSKNLYSYIKTSTSLTTWSCKKMEDILENYFPVAVSIVGEGYILTFDKILCKSLDVLDEKLPSIHMNPETMYWSSREYMNLKLVKPVLERADSVKQLGNSVLTSKYTELAADTLDGALNMADMYVEKYLPPQIEEKNEENEEKSLENQKALKAIQHFDKFSRKLKRRLTKQALIEAEALKTQTKQTMNDLYYMAKLIVTDPKTAMEKAKQLWIYLSEDKMETEKDLDQTKSLTLNQYFISILEQTSRRIVHLINFAGSKMNVIQDVFIQQIKEMNLKLQTALTTFKQTHNFDDTKNRALVHMNWQFDKIKEMMTSFNLMNSFASLEQFALIVAGGYKYQSTQSSNNCHQSNHKRNINRATAIINQQKQTPIYNNQNSINKNSIPSKDEEKDDSKNCKNFNHQTVIANSE